MSMPRREHRTVEHLAECLVNGRTPAAAEALVVRLDADCFTELVARSTLSGRMTRELFRLLDEAFTTHLQAREIQELPEKPPERVPWSRSR